MANNFQEKVNQKSNSYTFLTIFSAFDLGPDQSLSETQIDDLIVKLLDPKTGLEIKTNKRMFKNYEQTFTGNISISLGVTDN